MKLCNRIKIYRKQRQDMPFISTAEHELHKDVWIATYYIER